MKCSLTSGIIYYPEPTMYPTTVAASRKGRRVSAVVPNAVGVTNAIINDETKIQDQATISLVENGEGFFMGSAATISVLTILLTVRAVYPATKSEANQPPTETIKLNYHHYL